MQERFLQIGFALADEMDQRHSDEKRNGKFEFYFSRNLFIQNLYKTGFSVYTMSMFARPKGEQKRRTDNYVAAPFVREPYALAT